MRRALDFRSQLLQSGKCSFTASTKINYDDELYRFTVKAVCGTDGSCEMTVTEPNSIAGITASIGAEGGSLRFGDTAVGFDALAGGRLSPMQLPQLLCTAAASDYISAVGMDADQLRVTFLHGYDEDELTVDVWFSDDKPTYTEISFEGRMLLSAEISDFVME